jgi:hypothetical protein
MNKGSFLYFRSVYYRDFNCEDFENYHDGRVLLFRPPVGLRARGDWRRDEGLMVCSQIRVRRGDSDIAYCRDRLISP